MTRRVLLFAFTVISFGTAIAREDAINRAAKDLVILMNKIPPREMTLSGRERCNVHRLSGKQMIEQGKVRVDFSFNMNCPSGAKNATVKFFIEDIENAELKSTSSGQRCSISCRGYQQCIIVDFQGTARLTTYNSQTLELCPIFRRMIAEMAQEAAAAKQEAAAAKRALRLKFVSDFRVDAWVNREMLQTNAFVYKDKVVGIRVDFEQMVAATEARFGPVVVTDVPTLEFTTKGQPLVLAVRIQGVRPVQFMGTEHNLPYGQYVGVYRCKRMNCEDFFD